MATTSVNEIIAGRKTFFITPDLSLFPENFCEEYLTHGYECYFVENDKSLPLYKKLEIIISVFKDVIFFFNIDAVVPGISWLPFIKNFFEKHNGEVLVGVMYAKRQAKEEKPMMERRFLYDIGLPCGCIQLEYQKKLNFGIIEKVLFANQAIGKRKNVRALANNTCTFAFNWKNNHIAGYLQDISITHFSFLLPEGKLNMSLKTKVSEVQFVIKGFHFRSAVSLYVSRTVASGETLFVFLFEKEDGTPGMDLMTRQLLIPRIYQLMAENCQGLLKQLYESAKRELAAEQSPEDLT